MFVGFMLVIPLPFFQLFLKNSIFLYFTTKYVARVPIQPLKDQIYGENAESVPLEPTVTQTQLQTVLSVQRDTPLTRQEAPVVDLVKTLAFKCLKA